MARKRHFNLGSTEKLCRVCLTQSNNVMYELTGDMVLDNEKNDHIPILKALEKVVGKKILHNNELPKYICPMCTSMLKMTFKFVYQFEETQRKLMKNIDTSTIKDEHQDPYLHEIKSEPIDSNEKELAPVEIIFQQNKFSLQSIIVVEDMQEEKDDYTAFLQNLGQEVSATFASKNKTKSNMQEPTDDIVSIYITDSENGVLPVKEVKIDEDTNTIDYVVLEKPEEYVQENVEDYIQENEEEYVQENMEDLPEVENSKIEYIEIDTQDDDLIETFIIENETQLKQQDEDISATLKETNILKSINIQDVIESLIIDTSNGKDVTDNKINNGSHQVLKKLIKVGTKGKEIVEEMRDDKILMGPADGNESLTKKDEEEEDIFEREIRFPCELCKKIFPRKAALKAHMKRTHYPKQRLYTCEICGYENRTRSGYVHHKNKHVGKKFTCEICNKTYYTRAVLKVHMDTHINKRQHLCNVCGKGFNYANALVYHMRLHTNERNYKCEYCGDTFRMPNSLKRHLRIHTGERPYVCEYCGRGFCSRGELQCHENIHTGYRPYHCKHCMKGFTKTHNLKLHLLSHTGPHGCEICGKSFIEMSILSMHYKIAHKDLLAKEEEDEELQ